MAPTAIDPYAPHGAVSLREKRRGVTQADVDEAVPDGTIAEVEAWVGDDPQRAERALAVELAKEDPRKGIYEGPVAVLAADAIPEGMTIDETETWIDEADDDEEKFLRAIRAVQFEQRQEEPRKGILEGRTGDLVDQLRDAVTAFEEAARQAGDGTSPGEAPGSPGDGPDGDGGGSDPGDG